MTGLAIFVWLIEVIVVIIVISALVGIRRANEQIAERMAEVVQQLKKINRKE